ncbi:M1 family metallopeptidase [bacterium]|nr:M1 family metallopeptidase [bacterium]
MKKITIPLILISLIFAQKPYFQQDVVYDIDVTLNDSLHTLSAYEKIIYTNNSQDELDFIWFHLWPNAYKNNETAYAKQRFEQESTRFYFADEEDRGYIDSLDFKVDGESVDLEYHPEWIDVAKIHLQNSLLPGESILIETPFFVKIPKVYSRLGHSKKHYEITQWYPKPAVYDNDGWHPMPYLNMGEFYSEFGTFDVKITLPQNYRIMATGDLIDGEIEYAWLDSLASEGDKLHNLEEKEFKKRIKELTKSGDEEPGEMKTLHFHQENVHDFAWFADPKWIIQKGNLKFEESGRNVTLWSMYLPKNAELWENSIEYINDATYWYSKFYLEYPYNHVTAVDGDMSAGGGMEYPNITVISSGGSKDMLEDVIMHEVGHNWLYGIAGFNERDHAWQDEGLNTYTNIRYWEKKYGDRGETVIFSDFIQNKLKIANRVTFGWLMGYFQYNMRAVTGDEQPIDITSAEVDPGNYGSLIYGKVAVYTYYLQHYLGEEMMDKIMQEYFDKWKFKHPQPLDIRQAFESNTDADLSWYFDGVLNDTKTVNYAIKKKGDSFIVINKGELTAPVEIAYYNSKGDQVSSEWVDGFTGSKTFASPEGAVKAIADPSNLLPDLNKSNNTTKHSVGFDFVIDEPDYNKINVYWLPWLFSINEYNGWSPGALAYSGYIPTFNYGISVKPMWDFGNNKLIGSVQVQKKFYQLLGFRSFTLSAGYSDYQGRKGSKLAFNGLVRKPIISTPSTRIKATIYSHDIDKDAVTSRYYSSGKYLIGDISAKYSYRQSPLFRYSIEAGLMTSFCKNEFSKVNLSGDINWKVSKNSNTNLRGWVGYFLNDSYIPRQYRNYLSGGVDPNFNSTFVFNRMSLDDNTYPAIYESQYIQDGPALRGVVMSGNQALYSNEASWGINLTQSFTNMPLEFFVDFAGGTDLQNNYIDAGLTIDFKVIKLYLPVYQNWDEQSVLSDFDWLKERIRFEFSFNLNSISLQ